MAVDAGSARGTLDLNATGFFGAIQSAISELHGLQSASTQASGGIESLENSLSGAGGGLSGAMADASSAASGATSGVEGLGDAADTAGTHTGGFGQKLKTAWEHMKNAIPDTETLSNKLEAFGKKAQSAGKTLTKYVTTPLTAIGVYSVKTSMDFEKAMSQVQATMGATKEDMVDLEAAAKHMGETTQYTNTEAAQALNYLALAGYDSEQMIAALPSVLNLAAAGNMDLAEASDMLTDGLSALNLASDDSEVLMSNMETMVDQMAKTASRSNTSVEQLGNAILSVGGTANYLSGGITEVNQVLGLFADRGIKSNEAGTHLRNIILAMQPATDDAKEAFIKLGLGMEDADGKFVNLAYDANGTMKPLSEIFAMIQEGMSTMSDMEKQEVLADMFHRTDLAAANALIGTSIDRWNELGNEIENSAGAGSQMAATQLDNLSGEMTLLKSKIEALATTIGETLSPIVSDIVDEIGKWVDKFASLDPKTQEIIVKVGLFVAALGPALKIIGTLSTGIGKLVPIFAGAFTKLIPVVKAGIGALLSPATLGLGTVAAGIGALIAGWQIGSWLYDKFEEEINAVLYPIFDFFVGIWDGLMSFFTESIPNFFLGIKDGIIAAWNDIVTFFTETIPGFFQQLGERIKNALDSSAVGRFILNIFSKAWEGIKAVWDTAISYFKMIWENIKLIFSVVKKVFTGDFSGAWEGIKQIFGNVGGFFQGVWDKIKNIFAPVGDFFKRVFQKAWEGIKAIWDTVVNYFKMIWENIKLIFSVVKSVFTGNFSGAWEGIKQIFGNVGGFFQGVWDKIKSPFLVVISFFENIFKIAWNAVKRVFEPVGEFFGGIWDTIKDKFSTIGTKVADAIGSAFKTAINAVITVVEGAINLIPKAINGAIGLINELPGVEISEIPTVDLPRLAVGLDYVPYDDYQALLHKGERVLTKEENEEYTNNRTGGGDTYIFNSPEPIDEAEAAYQLKRVKQELAEGF